MAYYNSFYPYPMMNNQAPMFNNAPQPSSQNTNIVWVQGETGAKAYIVAPGCSMALWDSENQVIYIKTVDAAGIPTMRVMQWTEITNAPRNPLAQTTAPETTQPTTDYVTREEFNSLTDQFKTLSTQFDTLSAKTVNNKPYNQSNNPKKEEKNNG